MTPLEQQFVEVVAQEVYVHVRDGRIVKDCARLTKGAPREYGLPVDNPYGRDTAAKLLGMLIERNGASIEEIVEAFRSCLPITLDVDLFFRTIASDAIGGVKLRDVFKEVKAPPHLRKWGLSIPRLNIEGA